jgi:hypothetical protein
MDGLGGGPHPLQHPHVPSSQKSLARQAWSPSGTRGAVSFATLSGSSSGDKAVRIAQVFASTSPLPGQEADTFSGQSYRVSVSLTDAASRDRGVFDFTGRLWGSMSARSASLRGTFNSPLTVQHMLGHDDYAVTIGPFVSPRSPTVNGSLAMSVDVDPAAAPPAPNFNPPPGGPLVGPPGPPVNNAPEPAGVVLAAMAAGAGGLMWRRKRVAGA